MTEAHEGTRGNEATMWDDEAMHAAYKEAFDKDPDAHHWALLSWIRDDMQQALAAGAAARLRVEDQHAAALAELKAQLAERSEWEPLPDGYTHDNPNWALEDIRLCRRVQREDENG